MKKIDMLNDEQKTALYAYATCAGIDWKEQLYSDWMRSGSRYPGEWCYLQQIRNQFGPEWLAKVTLDMDFLLMTNS